MTNGVRNLSKARGRILELLAIKPGTVSSLSQLTGKHENTIREHLGALVNAELAIRYRNSTLMLGRPAWFYRLNDADIKKSGADENVGLATALAGHIARNSTRPRQDAILAGREWASHLVKEMKNKAEHVDNKEVNRNAIEMRKAIIELFTQLGFTPITNKSSTRVRLTSCPLLDVALQYPDIVCSVHLGILRGAMNELGATDSQVARVNLEPFSERGACTFQM